jgi:hypothetical protein
MAHLFSFRRTKEAFSPLLSKLKTVPAFHAVAQSQRDLISHLLLSMSCDSSNENECIP